MDLDKSTFLLLIALSTWTGENLRAQETESLSQEDKQGNEYIEAALENQPSEPPSVDQEYHNLLAALQEAKAKTNENNLQVTPKQLAFEKVPEIKSLRDQPKEDRERLYARLAEQTGLGIDEVRSLFESSKDQQRVPDEDRVEAKQGID